MDSFYGKLPGDIGKLWWNEVFKKVKNAVIFIDSECSESLHWIGGITLLFDAGAKNVKEFSSIECGEENDCKGVFIISTALSREICDTLKHIIRASSFKYCIIVTALDSCVLAYSRFGGQNVNGQAVINEIEQDILSWMGNINYSVEVLHYPLICVPFSKNVCLVPHFSHLFPLLDCDLPKIRTSSKFTAASDKQRPIETLGDVAFDYLPLDYQITIKELISFLNKLLNDMNCREDIYTLGATASVIGAELERYPPAFQRRKAAQNKVSLLFIDHTLDMTSIINHHSTTLMDKILSVLPRLYGHTVDSAIDMSYLSHIHQCCNWTLLPGCFSQPLEENNQFMELLILYSVNEALQQIKKMVLSSTVSDNKKADTEENMNIDILKALIKEKSSSTEFWNNSGFCQQATGVFEAVMHPKCEHFDQILAFEIKLLQSFEDSDETPPLIQVINLLKNRHLHGITLEEILGLLIYLASLDKLILPGDDEYTLINLLSEAILNNETSDCLNIIVGEAIDEVSALKTAQRIVNKLHSIECARNGSKKYKKTYHAGDMAHPASLSALLPRVLKDCLTAPPSELLDIEHKSAGNIKNLFKSGLSLIVNVSKPTPRDAPLMIIFIIGGISPAEVMEVQKIAYALNSQDKIYIMSSHFTYPELLVCNVLKQNPLLSGL